jgi:hypothetical protein
MAKAKAFLLMVLFMKEIIKIMLFMVLVSLNAKITLLKDTTIWA